MWYRNWLAEESIAAAAYQRMGNEGKDASRETWVKGRLVRLRTHTRATGRAQKRDGRVMSRTKGFCFGGGKQATMMMMMMSAHATDGWWVREKRWNGCDEYRSSAAT
ncbi:hypothetical protein ZHAS_00008298 [Anopheles sinensis]|uniref:Uncharacterized protein n=1 Tax=Anopheles sinensis TaxID=74873 RepID=A0A084VRT6_ANOSI|nr:hypothetical protein ZHAS_00008298 [Anopheles sinensis]